MQDFKYRNSIPFIRWGFPDNKKSDLGGLSPKRSILPELLLGILVFISYNSWSLTTQGLGITTTFIVWILIAFTLFTLAIVNTKTLLLPDKTTGIFAVLAVIFQVLVATQTNNPSLVGSTIAGSLIVGGIPLIAYIVSKGRWIGFGDVKLGFAAGLLLGWKAGLVCLVAFIALIALSVSVEIIISKISKTRSSAKIGTGVIWVLSIFLAFFIGQQIF